MQHTLTPFLIRALSKTEGEKRKEERQRGQTEEQGEGGIRGERSRAESVALISWQFGTGPDLPGKATDVSESVRHARREGTGIHTHMHVHTHSNTCVSNMHIYIYTRGSAHENSAHASVCEFV